MKRILVWLILIICIINNFIFISWADEKCCGYISKKNPFICGPHKKGYGNCTWWAIYNRPDLRGVVWRNASFWFEEANKANLQTGQVPIVGSIVVFHWESMDENNEKIDFGHVAYVEKVNDDNSFEVTEMGWDTWDCRNGIHKNTYNKKSLGGLIGFIYRSVGSYELGWNFDGSSQIIYDAYISNGGYNKLGYPFNNSRENGTAYVHTWEVNGFSVIIQDFQHPDCPDGECPDPAPKNKRYYGNDGQTAIIFNPHIQKAFLLKEEFWQYYKENNGPEILGPPTSEEVIDINYGYFGKKQTFLNGYLTWDSSNVRAYPYSPSNLKATPQSSDTILIDFNLPTHYYLDNQTYWIRLYVYKRGEVFEYKDISETKFYYDKLEFSTDYCFQVQFFSKNIGKSEISNKVCTVTKESKFNTIFNKLFDIKTIHAAQGGENDQDNQIEYSSGKETEKDDENDENNNPSENTNTTNDDSLSSNWVAIYRFKSANGAHCWNTKETPPPHPHSCSNYKYDIEAWIVPNKKLPGTYKAVQCSNLTDHIIVEFGSPDYYALKDIYDCSVELGYPYRLDSAPSQPTQWNNTCKLWRLSYDTSDGGAHLFTRGADDTKGMTCEGARGIVFSNFKCDMPDECNDKEDIPIYSASLGKTDFNENNATDLEPTPTTDSNTPQYTADGETTNITNTNNTTTSPASSTFNPLTAPIYQWNNTTLAIVDQNNTAHGITNTADFLAYLSQYVCNSLTVSDFRPFRVNGKNVTNTSGENNSYQYFIERAYLQDFESSIIREDCQSVITLIGNNPSEITQHTADNGIQPYKPTREYLRNILWDSKTLRLTRMVLLSAAQL